MLSLAALVAAATQRRTDGHWPPTIGMRRSRQIRTSRASVIALEYRRPTPGHREPHLQLNVAHLPPTGQLVSSQKTYRRDPRGADICCNRNTNLNYWRQISDRVF